MSIFGKGREMPFEPHVRAIVDAAMRLHQELGCGFDREVYVEALAIELVDAHIAHQTDLLFPMAYKGRELHHSCRADFRVPGDILVMVRAVNDLTDRHALELVSLLKVANATQGVLLNFGGIKFDMRHAVAPATQSP